MGEYNLFVLVKANGQFYHFWDKNTYDMPQFGDFYGAKKMRHQGAASAKRMLERYGETVTRKPVEDFAPSSTSGKEE